MLPHEVCARPTHVRACGKSITEEQSSQDQIGLAKIGECVGFFLSLSEVLVTAVVSRNSEPAFRPGALRRAFTWSGWGESDDMWYARSRLFSSNHFRSTKLLSPILLKMPLKIYVSVFGFLT